MTEDSAAGKLWRSPRVQRRAAWTFFVAAPVCALVIPGQGAVTLPIAFLLIGILLWQRSRPVKLSLNEEISQSLHHWMARVSDDRAMAPLRDAFQDHFHGIKMLEEDPAEAARKLRIAHISFDKFLAEYKERSSAQQSSMSGLAATARYHRGKTAYHLAIMSDDASARSRQLRSVLHDLQGFETTHKQWLTLVLPVIALRIEIHVCLNQLDDAETEQELLDVYSAGIKREPEIIATRRVIADAMWEAAATQTNEEIASGLQIRALIHYDDWLAQVGDDYLVARLIVAKRNGELEQAERVVALLADVIDDHRFAESAGNRGLLDANRLLARAYLQKRDYARAIRYYSVLMSVGGDANPYLRDAQVLHEISVAEEKHAEQQN